MSSDVMFRYRLAPGGSLAQDADQVEAALAALEHEKKERSNAAPWPIQWLSNAFLYGVAGLLLYGVYQRFVFGLL